MNMFVKHTSYSGSVNYIVRGEEQHFPFPVTLVYTVFLFFCCRFLWRLFFTGPFLVTVFKCCVVKCLHPGQVGHLELVLLLKIYTFTKKLFLNWEKKYIYYSIWLFSVSCSKNQISTIQTITLRNFATYHIN